MKSCLQVANRIIPILGLLPVFGLLVIADRTAMAQGSRRGAAVQSTKSLDMAAEKAQTEYLASLADLANKYEEAGDMEKAGEMLKGILKIKPDADVIKSKLKMFEEAVFRDNSQTIELDTSSGWTSTGILVSKDKPIRIEADGNYKFSVNDFLGPDGFATNDLIRGMAEAPCGGLLAVVGKSSAAGKGRRQDPKDLPHPIYIGSHKEMTPKDSGPLLLKINAPASAKCSGKIKVKITGNIAVLGN